MKRQLQIVIAGTVGLTLCVLLWKSHTTIGPDREAWRASRLLR